MVEPWVYLKVDERVVIMELQRQVLIDTGLLNVVVPPNLIDVFKQLLERVLWVLMGTCLISSDMVLATVACGCKEFAINHLVVLPVVTFVLVVCCLVTSILVVCCRT